MRLLQPAPVSRRNPARRIWRGAFRHGPTAAPAGSAVMQQVLNLSGTERDRIVADQVLSGNVPAFLRSLIPVTFSAARLAMAAAVEVTICVTPDYLAVGNDRDFVRVPMGLPAAARIADPLRLLVADAHDGRCDLCAGAGASGPQPDEAHQPDELDPLSGDA